MSSVGSLAVLLAGLVALCGCARLIAHRAGDPGAVQPSSGAASHTAAAALVGIVITLIAPATTQPMFGAAAAVAAFCTAAAIGLGREIGAVFGEPAYGVPTLSIAESGAPGTVSAASAIAAAVGASAIAVVAFQVRLIGPSDGGLIAFAAFFAMLFERWLAGVWKPTGAARLAPDALAAVAGAALASGFVVLLP